LTSIASPPLLWQAFVDGQRLGPLTGSEVERLLSSGEISGRTLVWREGLNDWHKLADTPELSTLCTIRKAEPMTQQQIGAAMFVPARPQHQVFVSYAFEDQAIADRIVAALEGSGYPCWIASRDIQPGSSFAQRIPPALRSSRLAVVVVSHHSNESEDVQGEIALMKRGRIPRIPFRVDDSPTTDALTYNFAQSVWLEAQGKDLSMAIAILVNAVSSHLREPLRG
jgi:hypothetical protein